MLNHLPHQNLVLIDPARRDANGRKTVAINDCTPDVCALNQQLLAVADVVMIKLSPMLDIASAERQLEGVKEIHVVSVGGECKEILIVLQGLAVGVPIRQAQGVPNDSVSPVRRSRRLNVCTRTRWIGFCTSRTLR